MTGDFKGTLLLDQPLAKHTSWRVGGPAQRLFQPADVDDLASFLRALPQEEPLLWLGLGSNVLVRDGGFPGTVIHTRGCLKGLHRADTQRVSVEAGAACAHVARFCAGAGLVGAEFLAGIPGTMGGALAMNAGSFGGETWHLVERVTTIDRAGVCRERPASDFAVAYRDVCLRRDEWFLTAVLDLQPGDTTAAQTRMRELLTKRAQAQPLNLPSCGSVFKNPSDDHAARLIEASGLKGLCIGGASVSDKHANFIVNRGQARAAEIEQLIEHVRQTVAQRQGVQLELEVRIVGQAEEFATL